MAFIKHGDGKILNVVDSEALTEEQKIAVKKVSKEFVKQSEDETTDSLKKKSGS